jgi:hypothetical protein
MELGSSLKLTLDIQFEDLAHYDKPVYDFLIFLSFLPPACHINDIKAIWNEWVLAHPDCEKETDRMLLKLSDRKLTKEIENKANPAMLGKS